MIELGEHIVRATTANIPVSVAERWVNTPDRLSQFLEELIAANDPHAPELAQRLETIPRTGGETNFTLIFPDNSQGAVYALAVAFRRQSPAERALSRADALKSSRRIMRTALPSSDRTGPLSYQIGRTSFIFGPVTGAQMKPRVSLYDAVTGDPSPIDGPILTMGEDKFYSYHPPHAAAFQTAALVIAHCLNPAEFPQSP